MYKIKSCIFVALFGFLGGLLYSEEKSEDKADHDFFVVPEFIYWRATGNGLFYATKSKDPSFVDGKIQNLDFSWNPGFRIGLGGYLPWDKWDLLLTFTHYHSTTRSGSDEEFLLPSWTTRLNPEGFVDSTHARWRLHLGWLDWELGRKFCATKCVKLRPFIGTRTAWIRQKYHIFYEGGSLFPGDVDHLSMKNKFWGMGIRLGMNSTWELPEGWGFYANAAYSLLYGDIYVHQSENVEPFRIHDEYMISRSITDLALGLKWEREIGGCLLEFHTGWEQHMMPGQNQFLHFDNPDVKGSAFANQGDLTLQGITIGTRLDF